MTILTYYTDKTKAKVYIEIPDSITVINIFDTDKPSQEQIKKYINDSGFFTII